MESLDEAVAENRRLRRAIRDMVALTTLPAVWFGLPTDGIARGLAQVLLDTLSLELVYIRLSEPSGAIAEVLRTGAEHKAVKLADVHEILERTLAETEESRPAIVGLFHREVRLAVTRFGVG